MRAEEARQYWDDWGLVLLWSALLAGPIAWGLNLQIGYALVKWACSRGQPLVLTLVAVVALAVALWGIWIGWSCLTQLRTADEAGGRVIDRSYFMAVVAIGLNILLAFLILTSAYHPLFLSPCE
jgi:hypothetical protein